MKIRLDLKIIAFLGIFYLSRQLKIYIFVMLFAFLHELAHLIVGIILGYKVKEIEIMPFGFLMDLVPKTKNFSKTIGKSSAAELKCIFVAIAGPVLNMILIFLLNSIQLKALILKQNLIYSNYILLFLNLIPIYPLDGGRIIQNILKLTIGNNLAYDVMNKINNITIILLTVISSIAILYLKNLAILAILTFLWNLVIIENKRNNLRKKFFKAKQV